MDIELKNVGRKFGQEWIFRNLSLSLKSGEKCAVVGSNGSGKSTLMKMISGALLPSEGLLAYRLNGKQVEADSLYKYVSMVGPYTMLPEELTLMELIGFVAKFRELIYPQKELVHELNLWPSRNKQIRHFSSGMKQRLQLGLALYSQAPIILLDEPSSNLDVANTDWYLSLVERPMKDRVLLIASNAPHEYTCCSREIHIQEYKGKNTH